MSLCSESYSAINIVQSFVFSAGLLWEDEEWKCSVIYNHTLISHLLSVISNTIACPGIFIQQKYPVSTGIVGILQLIRCGHSLGSLSLWCHFKGVDIYCQCFSTQFYYNACFDLFCSCDHGTRQQSDDRDPNDESPSPSASRPCSPNLKHSFLLAFHPVMRRRQSVSKRISHNAWRGPCLTPA